MPLMDENCTLANYAHQLSGEIKNDSDPLAKPSADPSDWTNYLHEQEGGMISIAGRLGKAAGIAAPDRVTGLLASHNPLLDKLKGGDKPNVLQQGLFDFLAPSKAVAKPILSEYIKARQDFMTHIKDAPDAGMDVYKDEVSSRATDLLKKIKADPTKYGVDQGNVHMTTRFLEQVENGWPYRDYANEKAEATQHLESGLTKLGKAAIQNVGRAHLMINPMIYLFHIGETPVRVFSQYPEAAIKILPELFHDPAILLGKTIPEAEKAGVYTKALDTIDPRKWTKADWQRGLTGIPQTQTLNESLAYLLSKHGVNLDEALDRVALSSRDPLEMPMFMTAPDRGGVVSGLSWMRYVMFQHASYLNMIKRMADFKNPEMAAKAAGSFLLYTGINYALYGRDAAIPGAGIVNKLAHVGGDGSEDQTPEEESPGGNLVYRATGLDLGEAMSPLSFFDLYHSVKMLDNVKNGVSSDIKALQKDSTTTAKGFALAHMGLLGSELFGYKGFTTPNSITKAVKSYGKAVNDAADNPLDVDWDEFYKNEIEANLGQRVANRFKEHQNR